ncbi:poly [ADP-ribose] polymerase [Acrasis kona]|uniref:Poly [ADP-ribose] polymerase n=1 Tax=Acrasis kona TaxID=1008807 RepID=A0AAW2YX65_9EUKA
MLELNNQNPKGEAALPERCAYGMMFGALPKCDREGCKDNFLEYSASTGKYCCTGHNEWSKCTYEADVDDIQTKDWVMPDDYDDDFINNFKFVKHKKVNYIPPSQVKKSEESEESEDEEDEEKKKDEEEEKNKLEEEKKEKEHLPLGNYVIAFAGRLSLTQNKLKQIVEDAGGSYSTTVVGTVDYLITSSSELDSSSQKIKQAKQHNVPIMEESFIHDSVENNQKFTETESQEYCLWKPKSKKRKVEEMEQEGETETETGAEKQSSKRVKIQLKGDALVAVDSECKLAGETHVLQESTSNVYSANLNLTDITNDTNQYYILQVLRDDDDHNQHYLYRRWGRLGTTIGGSKIEDFNDKHDAIAQFTKLYFDKTANHWSDRKNFAKKPNKFYPVDVDFVCDVDAIQDTAVDKLLSENTHSQSQSTLNPAVRDLMSLIFDVKEMQKTLIEMEIDTNKMPLGRLSRVRLLEGFSVLKKIQEKLNQQTLKVQELEQQDEQQESKIKSTFRDAFIALSNEFYTKIPHVFEKNSSIPLIDSDHYIKQKNEMINTLMEMEIATSLINQSSSSGGKDVLLDHYNKLNTNLEPLDKKSKEFVMLNNYLLNTHASTHSNYKMEVLDIFKVERQGERELYLKHYKDVPNKQLLWHGSRLTNWAGILSQGLRIAPPEAPSTGYMFGKGVYFANMSSKSANYCFTSRDKNIGILILNEVALGDTYNRFGADYITTLPSGKQSTWGKGSTTPDTKDYQELDGVVVPMGKGVRSDANNTSLLYDEFITYDTKQSNIRYLFKTRFDYK